MYLTGGPIILAFFGVQWSRCIETADNVLYWGRSVLLFLESDNGIQQPGYVMANVTGWEIELMLAGLTVILILLVVVVALTRVTVARARLVQALQQRIEERTRDLVSTKLSLERNRHANRALRSSVSKKLTAVAATLKGIQHLESTDGTEMSSHLAAIVDDLGEATRMLHQEHEPINHNH